jgi:hypothetical protein
MPFHPFIPVKSIVFAVKEAAFSGNPVMSIFGSIPPTRKIDPGTNVNNRVCRSTVLFHLIESQDMMRLCD